MEMVKLMFYFHVSCLLILTTLNDANGVPIRIISRTRFPKIPATTKKTESIRRIPDEESPRKISLLARKENFKLHPGFQKKLEKKNITQIDDAVTKITNNNSGIITLSNLFANKMPMNFLEARRLTTPQPKRYYPPAKDKLDTVCFGRSTIYNRPIVKKYLKTQLTDNWHIWWRKNARYRPYFNSLRKLLYDHGRAEECHTRKNGKPLLYLNCALLRHMRMEYLIPMYPLHQVYFFDKSTTLENNIYH